MNKCLLIFLLLLSGTGLFSQERINIPANHDTILFIDFFMELESDAGLKVYYQDEIVDTLIFTSVKKGDNLEDFLEETLPGFGLTSFLEGNELYVYRGLALTDELPEYESYVPIKKAEPENQEKSDERYIQSLDLSREMVITVGRERQAVKGKNCKITGLIRSKSSGESLIGATLYIEELELGTISDVNGNFSFNIPAGLYTISIHHMAMKEIEYGLKVLSSGMLTIELEDDLIELEEVTVVNKRTDNVEGMQMGFERISTKSIKEIPAVMGEKDILKVAQMLPGVQSVGEGSSGFNVRGGSADQNMFYLNKISIYNTSHLFGFFTSFSPDIVSDFSLYKNNIPAHYGGKIASVFEINTREGNKEKFFAQGGISPVTGHMSVEVPVIKEKVSVVASIRSTYSDWLLKRIKNQDIYNSNAAFYDGTFEISADINKKNTLNLFAYQSSDRFSLSTKNDYTYANSGASAIWGHRFSDKLSFDLSFSSSEYNFTNIDKNNLTEAYFQDYSIIHHEGRMDFVYLPLDKHRVEFGINSVLYDLDRGAIEPYGNESRRVAIDLGKESGFENSVYLSDEWSLHQRLKLMLGVRYSYYQYLGPGEVIEYEPGVPRSSLSALSSRSYGDWETIQSYNGLEPRLAMNFRLANDQSVKASYSRLNQYIFLLSNTIALSPTDQWKLTDYYLAPPRADQVSVGYYQDFNDEGINLSVEAYRKWIDNVVEYKDGVDFISGEAIETQTLQGDQDVYGMEIMVNKTSNNLTGWVSYTYSRSIVSVNDPNPLLRINRGNPYPSNYDRPHSFNLVANYRFSRRLSVSSNIVYSSGRPITLPIGLYYSEGQQYLHYSERNEFRIPDYFRIDFSVNLEGNLRFKKLAHSFWMLNVYNLTGRDNAYSVFYSSVNGALKGYKLSIFAQPIVTLSWNFKFGNYNSDL